MDTAKDLSTIQYYSVRDAADFMGLSEGLLNKLRVMGGGPPYFKLGRAVKYKRSDLVEWAEARKFLSTSQYDEL